ncbi:MAG TPA: flagellar biosynthesis regulator FlaF [Pseudolabrys sp.]|nr:flagellar biosynthesis regulator FlaF [Pseudolabrys sp.]
MHHAAKAYSATAQKTANPREVEADLLLDAAARLQAVRDGWDERQDELSTVLLNNRRLWAIFVSTVTSPDNPLPAQVRQNIANLGLFVINRTLAVLANPRAESLAILIRINRELAAGLMGRA